MMKRGQQRDRITEHAAERREAVQQQERRAGAVAGLAPGDLEAVDVGGGIAGLEAGERRQDRDAVRDLMSAGDLAGTI